MSTLVPLCCFFVPSKMKMAILEITILEITKQSNYSGLEICTYLVFKVRQEVPLLGKEIRDMSGRADTMVETAT